MAGMHRPLPDGTGKSVTEHLEEKRLLRGINPRKTSFYGTVSKPLKQTSDEPLIPLAPTAGRHLTLNVSKSDCD